MRDALSRSAPALLAAELVAVQVGDPIRAGRGWETAPVSAPAYLASLRVFSPLSTFPSGERRRWERYVAAGRTLDRQSLLAAEHAAALAASVRPTLDVDEEHALVEIVDGVTYLCPARTQLRVWQAAGEFREGLAALLADAFVPPQLAQEAEEQLAGWREVSPDLRPHIRTAAWSVPMSWLLAFDPGDVVRTPDQLRYATPIADARERLTDALRLLDGVAVQLPLVPELADLLSWLAPFGDDSRVELDYGALAQLLGEDLADENSVGELQDGLSAFARGDTEAAGRAYERFVERWRPVQLRETAS